AIPYQKNPNLMFNSGGIWKGFLATVRDKLVARLPDSPSVIDIGCGEGHFVRGSATLYAGKVRFIGFDHSTSESVGCGIEFYPSYLEPLKHMTVYSPDSVIIRHVLEHLTNPATILEELAWAATSLGKPCWLYAEVPCIDRVFETKRIADFFY